MENQNQPITASDSLESVDSTNTPQNVTLDSTPATPENSGVVNPSAPKTPEEDKPPSWFKRLLSKINIYFILLIVVLLILAGISYYAIISNRESVIDSTLNTQELTEEALDRIAGTDSQIGDPKQTLSIESNAIFSGSVLVRGNFDVAGTLKMSGALSLPGLTVGGTTSVDQLAAKSLTVAGDTAIQGKATVQNGLSVTGAGSFSGALSAQQVTAERLQLSGDLQFTRHLDPNGGTPTRSNGSALGGGGSASNSGTDTAGTISIGTGNAAPAGCFVTITFTAAYTSVPHVVISPASSQAAALDYYTNRTATGFSVCTASDPADNTAGIVFDYIVVD